MNLILFAVQSLAALVDLARAIVELALLLKGSMTPENGGVQTGEEE